MSVTRRQFLLSTAGAAVGAIVPSFYYRALEFFEQHESPLLIPPERVTQDLCLLDVADAYSELCLGNPYEEPPRMTYREYFERYAPEWLDTYEEEWDLRPCELDNEIHSEYVTDAWVLEDSPAARAYKYLESLDLGPQLQGPDAVGGLDFKEDSNMVSYWRYVTPRDEVSLSLLQQRLNDLGTGIRVLTGFAV